MVLKKMIMSVCAVAALSVASADDASARDTLRVGTEPTFAPFEFMDTQTREFVGYDIDLIRAIADKAGYDIKVVNMGFDALIPIDESVRLTFALLAAMPAMSSIVMMAKASGSEGDYAMGGIFVTTVCSIVSIPVVFWVLQQVAQIIKV